MLNTLKLGEELKSNSVGEEIAKPLKVYYKLEIHVHLKFFVSQKRSQGPFCASLYLKICHEYVKYILK